MTTHITHNTFKKQMNISNEYLVEENYQPRQAIFKTEPPRPSHQLLLQSKHQNDGNGTMTDQESSFGFGQQDGEHIDDCATSATKDESIQQDFSQGHEPGTILEALLIDESADYD